jgi:2-amino-4-hydroxy-6-hydroxymethyldihydropteridine diphosphokinase
MINKVYLLLGSNLGNPHSQIETAKKYIQKKIGDIIRESGMYSTAAWGHTKQPDFLNQVIIAETLLDAEETMQTILYIEKKMGRVRTKKNAPRIIDIDILFFNRAVISKPIVRVPHPLLHERNFVLVPLNELSPNLLHPELHKSIHQLLLHCPDKLTVKKI